MNIKKTQNSFTATPTHIFTQSNSLPDSNQSGVANLNDKLQQLNERINKLHKQLTYWDMYHITQTVSIESEFGIKYNALKLGESMIINTDNSFTYNQQIYSRGDVVMKMENGEMLYIPTRNGGVYYPTQLTLDDSDLKLEYSFSEVAPTQDQSSDGSFAKNMTFTQSLEGITSETAYHVAQTVTNNNITFTAIDGVKPIIKFFFDNEETYIDYQCVLSNGSYTVTLKNFPANLIIVVK